MPTEPTDPFLRAEQEAQRLVEVLAQLKKEIESYKTARGTLEETAQRLRELSDRGGAAAQQLGALAKTLQAVATDELLNRLDGMGKQLASLQQALPRMQEALVRQQQEGVAALKALVQRLPPLIFLAIGLSAATLVLVLGTLLARG